MEVSPPDDVDPADTLLGLPQLFSNTDDSSSFPSSDPAVDIPVAAASHRSTTHLDSSVPVELKDSGGCAAVQHPQSPRKKKRFDTR
ncbi:unnamed protein product [Arctogadus glacialis]